MEKARQNALERGEEVESDESDFEIS